MTFVPPEVEERVLKISEILRSKGQTIAVSESACGGLISSYLVSIAGASQYYHGGTLTYSLKSRLKLSGWSEEDIRTYTGPSENVALRLARNLRFEMGTTYAFSETGWAGPTGASGEPDDSVGQVFFAIVGPNGEVSTSKLVQHNNRAANMAEFALLALQFLLETLS